MREDVFGNILADVAVRHGLRSCLLNRDVTQLGNHMHLFSDALTPKLKARDQNMTGFCWLFAGLALLRQRILHTMDLTDEFELSHTHLVYYDKLHKAESFLKNVQRVKNNNMTERHLHYLLDDPIPDGGGWHAFAALVDTYGVLPATCMRPTDPADFTRDLNLELSILLRQSAHRILHNKECRDEEEEKKTTIGRVTSLLDICLGTPKTGPIEWIYKTKDGAVHTQQWTPQDMLHKCLPCHMTKLTQGFVTLTNLPDATHPLNRAYAVEFLDTVPGHEGVFHNVDIAHMEAAVSKSIKGSTPVWFACEFDASRYPGTGLLHHDLIRHERAIGEPREKDKGKRIEARATSVDHAMLITGAHRDAEMGNVERWQVLNSHGDDDDADGYLCMTPEWFRMHVFSVTVPTEYAPPPPAMASAHAPPPPTTLPPWDILGFVARITPA